MQTIIKKQKALNYFTESLLKTEVKESIGKIFLFGSMAKGQAQPESDIDLLIFTTADLNQTNQFINKISYEILTKQTEVISPVIYPWQNYLYPDSYFVYHNTREGGREIYTMSKKQLKKQEAQGFFVLAKHFLKSAINNTKIKDWRAAADLGYNTVELCLKAMLRLKMDSLPTRHTGIIQKFSQYYIKTGKLPDELGGELQKALQLRNQARYVPNADITIEKIRELLVLGKKMIKEVKKYL